MSRFQLPVTHAPGMRVPAPGASCANCRFAKMMSDGPHCTNLLYQRWAGTSQLIDPFTKERVMNPQEYCSDWYEPMPEGWKNRGHG